jgi:hypothetical protein
MNAKHLTSTLALAGFVFLAFGSSDGDGSGGSVGKSAARDISAKVCEGDKPFQLPLSDEGLLWAATAPYMTYADGLYVTRDREPIKGQIDKSAGWLVGEDLKSDATYAVGQLCGTSPECVDTTCTIEESLFNMRWILEFRETPEGYQLVGFFESTLEPEEAERQTSVAASQAAFEAEMATITSGMPAPAAE